MKVLDHQIAWWCGGLLNWTDTLLKMPNKMLHLRTVGIAHVFSLNSNAKRKQCNCTASQTEGSVSPEIIYTEGLSVPHFGPSGDATLLELAVSLNFLL